MAACWGTSMAISFRLWTYLMESTTGITTFKPCTHTTSPKYCGQSKVMQGHSLDNCEARFPAQL